MRIKRSIFIIVLAVFILMLAGCSSDEPLPKPSVPRPNITVTETADIEPLPESSGEGSPLSKPTPFQNNYNVTLEINPAQRKVLATEKISYKNTTGRELDKIYVRFNINAFSEGYQPQPFFDEFKDKVYKYGVDYSDFAINAMAVNSKKASYEINGRNIGIILDNPLPSDSNIEITMQFECSIPKISHRIGSNNDALWFGNFIPVIATYFNGEFVLDQYYPAGEPFVYDMSNYDVTITTPSDYKVFGSGIEKITVNETNRITRFTINMIRDFAFVMSNKYETASKTSEAGITINFHHYSDNPQRVSMVLDAAALSADFYSDRIGTYPYQKIDIAETELPFEGANTFPCIIFIDSDYFNKAVSYDSVGQEVCRQWFYNVVGSNQIKEPWLDAGLTTYLQARMNFRSEMVDMRMRSLYATTGNKLRDAENYALTGDLSVYKTWDEYYTVHHNRAALMFHALYRKMGVDKWNEFLKAYYNENTFKVSTKQKLIDIASRVEGEKLDDFFESWMTWRELPNLP